MIIKFKYGGILICIAGLLMLVYSFLTEKYNIYFFWESSLVGFLTLLLGLTLLLLPIITSRKQQKKEFKPFMLLAGLISCMLLLFAVSLFIFYNSDAYLTSKDYLIHNEVLKNELGNINDVSIVLSGEMSSGVKNSNTPTNGTAEFLVIVKGEQKYKKVVISLTKEEDKWSVINYTTPL